MKDENTLLIGDITSWIDKLFIKNHLKIKKHENGKFIKLNKNKKDHSQ